MITKEILVSKNNIGFNFLYVFHTYKHLFLKFKNLTFEFKLGIQSHKPLIVANYFFLSSNNAKTLLNFKWSFSVKWMAIIILIYAVALNLKYSRNISGIQLSEINES